MSKEINFDNIGQTKDVDAGKIVMRDTPTGGAIDRERFNDVPVTLSVELAQLQMTFAELNQLKEGKLIPLGRTANDPVSLYVNGTKVCEARAKVVDGQFELEVTKLSEF